MLKLFVSLLTVGLVGRQRSQARSNMEGTLWSTLQTAAVATPLAK